MYLFIFSAQKVPSFSDNKHSLNQIFIEIENIHFFAFSMLFRMNSTKIHGCPNDIHTYLLKTTI